MELKQTSTLKYATFDVVLCSRSMDNDLVRYDEIRSHGNVDGLDQFG